MEGDEVDMASFGGYALEEGIEPAPVAEHERWSSRCRATDTFAGSDQCWPVVDGRLDSILV